MTRLRIALLGPPKVTLDDVAVSFDTRKATALLAYLAVTGRPHGRDTLAGLLWPDHEQDRARGALRRTLSVLNSATGREMLTADRSTVALRIDGLVQVDVVAFREQSTRRSHDHPADSICPRCRADLEAATALYRDDFLAGFTLRDSPEFDDWRAFEADALRQDFAGVLELLVRTRVHTGDLEAALETARRWLMLDPLHEPAHAMLMRLHAWTGQRSAAIRQYRECVRVLHCELGVPPLSQTTALDAAVRSGRLEPPRPQPAGSASAPTVTTQTRAAGKAGTGKDAACVPGLPLVGRTRELAVLDTARAAASGAGHLIVISGEAGIGKSRLLAEVNSATVASGRPVAVVRCHRGEEGLVLGVIADVLRAALRVRPGSFASLPSAWQAEVTRLLPEQALTPGRPEPPPLDSPGAQSRFCAALVGMLSAALGTGGSHDEAGAVLAVEDVHWADDSSADVLAYLVRRLRDVGILLVLTWRPDSLSRVSALHAAVTDAVRAGFATNVELDRLDRPAVATLCAAALPGPMADETVGRLWQETGGLPLFVVEFLEAFRRAGQIPAGEHWRLPGGVRELLEARLAGLSETTLQVLAAGAVLGGDMTPALVRATSGRGEEEVVAALEEAVARASIVDTDRHGGTYEFRHDAMRRLVYDRTTLARRRLLHSRAADALAERRDCSAATVAAHLRLAGRDGESAEWSWRAAELARRLYAHSQALEHLGAAAALGYPGHLVHLSTGDVMTVLGRYRDALLAFEQAAATCPAADRPFLAMLEHRLADVHHRLGEWDVADSHLVAASDLLASDGDQALHARVLADVALVAHRRGDVTSARSAANLALETATSADDDAALAQAHDVLGVLASERGDVEVAERHLRDSLGHAASLSDPSYRCAALNNLALLQAAAGRPAEALALAREALHLGLEQGDRHRAAALHTNLADLLHDIGEQDEARRHLTSAARLFAGVDDEQLRRPEIWKLASW